MNDPSCIYKRPSNAPHPNLIKTIQEAAENGSLANPRLRPCHYQKRSPLSPPSILPPSFYRNCENILVFDTETTGLLPRTMKLKAPDTWPSVDLIQMPSVIQLSFIIYNQRTCEITHLFNEYIDIDDRIFISDEVTRITGIDRDTLDARGIPMFYALSVFLQCVKHCGAIVAHNSDFDMRMIIVEMMRYGFPVEGVFDRLQICCTQTMGQPICRLPSKSAGWMKPPRLSELYVYLFGTQMDNLHNAIVDVLVCFRCFLKLAFDREMTEPEFQSMVAFNLQEP